MTDINLLKRKIEESLKGGFSIHQITPTLISLGFGEEDIEKALKKIKEIPKGEKKIEVQKKPKVKKKEITTVFDSLYDMIKKRKQVGLNEIVLRFSISRDKAEEWARILEAEGKVEIKYRIKDTFLEFKGE